jgi:hypothetical protein
MSWLRHLVSVPPSVEPVTTDDVKLHCRITSSTEDSNLALYAKAARRNIEARCGAKIINQTVLLQCSHWADLKNIPLYPLVSVTDIKYLDEDGNEQTLDPAVYTVVAGRNPRIYLKPTQSWPLLYYPTNAYWPAHHHLACGSAAPDAIRVRAVMGFGATAAEVPEDIKLAIYALVGTWNENRESIGSNQLVALPDHVHSLLADYTVPA